MLEKLHVNRFDAADKRPKPRNTVVFDLCRPWRGELKRRVAATPADVAAFAKTLSRTPGEVLSWDVPPEVVGEALSLPRDGTGRRVTLAEVAAAQGVSVGALAGELAGAIATYRADR